MVSSWTLKSPNEAGKYCNVECYHTVQRAKAKEVLVERFWSKVDKSGECWIWLGSRFGPDGYGAFAINAKNQGAHRVSWELTNGPIPKGLMICHTCDNRPCVRPDHLFLGTALENWHDMDRKNRRGHPGMRKLTLDLVATIRHRYAAGGISVRKLAKEYGVNHSTIQHHLSRDMNPKISHSAAPHP